MTDEFTWATGVTINDTNLNRNLARNPINLVRNGSFESYIGEGTSAAPDAWEWTANDGTIARDTAHVGVGDYAVKITKASTDGGSSTLTQTLTNLLDNDFEGEDFTVSAKIWQTATSATRIYIADGIGTTYSDHTTSTDTWVDVSVTRSMDASATKIEVGIQVEVKDNSSWIDAFQLCRGTACPDYVENPADRSLICQEYDNDGTIEVARSLRIVPFTATFTLAGGATYESEQLTVPTGYEGNEIISAWAAPYSAPGGGGTEAYNVHLAITGYDTTPASDCHFDIVFKESDGGSLSAGDYTVKGAYVLAGWDDYTKVFN